METKTVQFDVRGISVMLAMPAYGAIPWQTTIALLETYACLLTRGIPIQVQMAANCSLVELARSRLASQFMQSDANRLFWVDSDIVWKADDFLRLVALSSKMDVVGAAYPTKSDELKFYIGSSIDGQTLNEYGCLEVDGFGLGFTVVSRNVIEQLAMRAPRLSTLGSPEPIPHLFRLSERDGQLVGEDIGFFRDIRALGVPVHLDPSIELGHVGTKVYTARAADYLSVTPPA